MDNALQKKVAKVHEIIKGRKVLIAFSGGVDSSTVARLAKDVAEKVKCVTIKSQLITEEEIANAEIIAKELGIDWQKIEIDILSNDQFVRNPPYRCYLCKKDIMKELISIAKQENFDLVIDGTNEEDLTDYRPGHMALVEMNIRSPLAEARIKKNEVRTIAESLGLSVWKRPSMPCLASRIPYGDEITLSKLDLVKKAENYIKYKANVKVVRVRCYENLAKIEIGKNEMKQLYEGEIIEKIVNYLKELGFKYVTLDLEGYRSGAMDEILERV